MHFVDEVTIYVRAGRGGRGSPSFHRAKSRPLGGPDGGDGGHGGSIFLEARTDHNTLIELRFNQRHIASDGRPGAGNQKTGARGADKILRVPVGTVVRNADSGALIGDLTAPGQRLLVARGGRGGWGNLRFVSPTHRAPLRADDGGEGEEARLHLELKSIADVGLIGFPNAGKSTLISRISAARPRIADYPFTTLVPNLGVVRVEEERSFVVADIPGLIEGASEGAGLGLKFLRHIERTRMFLHLLSLADREEKSPDARFDAIQDELRAYNPELLARPQWVILTQIDVCENPEAAIAHWKNVFEARGLRVFALSAVTGRGVRELIFDVAQALEHRQDDSPED